MADNIDLGNARKNKNDEFYTRYEEIEAEMNAYYEYDHDVFRGKTVLCPCDDPEMSNFTRYFAQNFSQFGLKKLICTSYAESASNKQLSLFEKNSPYYIPTKHENNGRLYTLEKDTDENGEIDIDDIQFRGYLKGNGDFRSKEVCKLRDEADIIITNPPFSLFREFLAWIMEADKEFAIIGNVNAITYKEVFPLIKENKIWLGYSIHSGDRAFYVPKDYPLNASGCGVDDNGRHYIRVKGVRWFTNLDHGLRHESMRLDTMAHNLKFNKKLRKKLINAFEQNEDELKYPIYDNYDAIEVPFTECIPSDYDGVMGVPITFMDKYNPDQFTIIGADGYDDTPPLKTYPHKEKVVNGEHMKSKTGALGCTVRCKEFGQGTYFDVGYPILNVYKRIFIKAKRNKGDSK